MKIIVIHDDINWLHTDPRGEHPENPHRLELVLNSLKPLVKLDLFEFQKTVEPKRQVLSDIHDDKYVEFIEMECRKGFHYIDSDTYVTEHSFNVALRFSTSLKKHAVKGFEENNIVIALTRPPGHHAGYNGKAMGASTLGFCIFNHSAVADYALLEKTNSILHIDFDAHHGNGTQDILWNDPRVIHVDIHQYGAYPGTGWVEDIGGRDAEGSKINIPLPRGASDSEFMWIVEKIIKQLITTYRFKAVVVSAGFDSYIGDGLAELEFTENSYIHIGSLLHEFYKAGVIKTIVNVLEGGYGEGLQIGFINYVRALIGFERVSKPIIKHPPTKIYERLKVILKDYHEISI